jgi:hypothetical protein
LLGRKTEDFKLETLTAVSRRAERALDRVLHGSRDLLGIALNHLTLGRAAFYAAIREGSASRPRTSDLSHIDDAVSGLRRAGTQHHLPRALLTCAWQRFLEGKRTGPGGAQENLDEAWEIAERGAMKLFLADIHLYRARLFFHEGEYPWNKNPDGSARGPRDDLDAAAKLIRTCGYHRRDEELAVARAVIGMERHQIEQ